MTRHLLVLAAGWLAGYGMRNLLGIGANSPAACWQGAAKCRERNETARPAIAPSSEHQMRTRKMRASELSILEPGARAKWGRVRAISESFAGSTRCTLAAGGTDQGRLVRARQQIEWNFRFEARRITGEPERILRHDFSPTDSGPA